MDDSDGVLRATWEHLGGSPSDDVIERIIALHSDPARHYHTADHIAAVLHHVDVLLAAGLGTCDADVVRAGALFHDVVYDPCSSCNESDSAAMALVAMGDVGWRGDRLAMLSQVILATATHEVTSVESSILVDADLAILGSDEDVYRRYVGAVRLEYGHLDDDRWGSGRATVLRSFLARTRIFATAPMYDDRERTARMNLSAELAALRR